MIGRLTLNLRMYDPAANTELSFPTMSLMQRISRAEANQAPTAEMTPFDEPWLHRVL